MKLGIYKRSQGTYTRLGTAFALSLITALGCLKLYDQLSAIETKLDPNVEMWVQILIPAVLLVLFVVISFWLINKPKIADFMIESEGEMKKVSWSSRQEIFVSTLVVIVVVFLMAIFLGSADFGFSLFFSEVIGI